VKLVISQQAKYTGRSICSMLRLARSIRPSENSVSKFPLQLPGFEPRSNYLGFMVEKAALGQVFSKHFSFSYHSTDCSTRGSQTYAPASTRLPQGRFLILIFVRGSVDPTTIVGMERLSYLKFHLYNRESIPRPSGL
jgi:hypothetical protein